MAGGSKKNKPNWDKIQAEYLNGGTSYRKLCEKYGLSLSTLRRYAVKHNWAQSAEKVKHDVDTALTQTVVANHIKNATDFNKLVEDMTVRLEQAIQVVDVKNAKSISLLTTALKNLQDMQGLNKTDLDKEEQRQRIAALRARTAAETNKDTPNEIALIFEDNDNEPT